MPAPLVEYMQDRLKDYPSIWGKDVVIHLGEREGGLASVTIEKHDDVWTIEVLDWEPDDVFGLIVQRVCDHLGYADEEHSPISRGMGWA